MPESTEIELKLALVKGRLGRARRAIGNVRTERAEIEDVYYDTPDRTLRKRGLVLRVRHDDGRWFQTLKAADSERRLVPVRGEWEVQLSAGGPMPRLDLERFDVEARRILFGRDLDAAALAPVFSARTTRECGTLAHGDSRIEVALDRGELRTDVDGARRRLPIAELELELKSGRAEHLVDMAFALVSERGGLHLVPALRSKAERGYALAGSDGLNVARASGRGFAQCIDAAMPAHQALRAIVRHGLAIVVANADALRAGSGGEHLHQARVALRRMRSAIRLFDPDAEDFPADALRGLQRLARTLGEARDWDVVVDETLPRIAASDGLVTAEDGLRLAKTARRRHDRALQRATRAVASHRYARLVLDIARWTMAEGPAASALVSAAAPERLDDAADRLFASARRFARLAPHRRHRVRILAKRLRYALDLFAPTLPAHAADDYIDSLETLQDSLGELTDAYVAVELLRDHAKNDAPRDALAGWLARVEPELARRAARQITALGRRPRAWSKR